MTDGWFTIPGVQRGARELREQLQGLKPALAAASGQRVLDVGCAEGLIARAMLEAGAASVECVENNPQFVARAREQLRRQPAVVHNHDLNNGLPSVGPADIVLMLAILHKLKEPLVLLGQAIERTAAPLFVIRYPRLADGVFVDGRSHHQPIDVAGFLREQGYRETERAMGPRRELTVYYRRQPGAPSLLTPHSSRV